MVPAAPGWQRTRVMLWTGRPVFASEFFAPLDGRLRALVKESKGSLAALQSLVTELLFY
jgi:hypothetical protein